ncbi:MAG: AAA family ATPase [Chloroflexota bacterium]|nr:MAG: AAA family ATPase [Chloroflexota bacterium]
MVLAAVLSDGHLLIEDVPGVGKTMLARAFAVSLGGTFRRIQFTPDLLPNDVTGVSIFNQKTGDFEFRAGPIFTTVLLADEINRATPRTQSALLECMGERQVTVDGIPRALPRPFIVMATQNPIEYEGTFPLPEAQLDRFIMRMRVGYPGLEEERQMTHAIGHTHPIESVRAVSSGHELVDLQARVADIYVADDVRDYALRLARSTRDHGDVALGVSPRGTLALIRVAQALAAIRGDGFVLPDDVKRAAIPCLAHRLLMRTESQIRGRQADAIVTALLGSIDVPIAIPR